jgi:hypothetical protein
MDQLSKICTPSKELFLPQLLFLKDAIEEKGGKLEIIHKFLIKIEYQELSFFVKFNLTDNEYFVIEKENKISIFPSFYQFRNWILEKM